MNDKLNMINSKWGITQDKIHQERKDIAAKIVDGLDSLLSDLQLSIHFDSSPENIAKNLIETIEVFRVFINRTSFNNVE